MERKAYRPGGFPRPIRWFRQNQESVRLAEEKLKEYQKSVGEQPSAAIYPENTDDNETVIYLADKTKKRKVKRRRERISIATPSDIVNRYREQLERYVEYEHYAGHPGNLTLPWRRFGVKHREQIQKLKG
jgi:hypothetical protein